MTTFSDHVTITAFSRSVRWRIMGGLFLAISVAGYAEIRVSPVAVYLGDDDLHARVAIQNSGSQSKEVEVDIQFGYPVSDDSGNVSFRFIKRVDAAEPSAVDWVRIFPRRFILSSGESQTLIVIANPPSGLPEGEFWARPILTFQTIGTERNREIINEPFQIVLSVNFRRGAVRTGVQIQGVSVQVGAQKANVIVELERLGNAALIGNIVCRLHDKNGVLRAEEKKEFAIYHSLKQKIELNISGLQVGRYVAEVELNTDRPGNNPGDILQIPSVSSRSELVINCVVGNKAKPTSSNLQGPTIQKKQGELVSRRLSVPKTDVGSREKAIEDTLEKLRTIQADLGRMLDSLHESVGN